MQNQQAIIETKTMFVHDPIVEKILDICWTGVFFYGIFMSATMEDAAGATGSEMTNTRIVGVLFCLAITCLFPYRISKHTVSLATDGETITYCGYRGYGYFLAKTATFKKSELGHLVLDTERRCGFGMCCMGFLGIYVTQGFPTFERPCQVAFEIPIIYNGWTSITEGCALGCYRDSFRELNRLLGFEYRGKDAYSQKTTWSGGSWAQNQAATLNSMYEDSMASYENLLAVNRNALPAGNFRFERCIESNRAVYRMITA